MKISVCLATFNEEKNIKDCLESVKWADEIIIVDGSSTDKTVAIAKKYKAKIIVKDNPLMFHINKQKAFEAASGDWILYFDADERVTPELAREIMRVVANRDTSEESRSLPRHHPRSQAINGFWIPRKNIIFGKWIEHTGWWPDYQLRLFRRGKASLPCQSVHEQPELTGKASYLKNPLIHYNYQTVSQFIFKLNNLYTENDKRVFLAEGKKFNWSDALRLPAAEFLKRFFKEEGYKDGFHGLVLSIFQSFSAFVTFAKIWEEEGFKKSGEENFLVKMEKEFNQIVKEFKYWFLTSQIEQTRNKLKKVKLKIKRKLRR